MPCTAAVRHGSSVALASAVVLLAVALSCLAPGVRAAEAPSKKGSDTSVTITASPPAIHVDATTAAKKDQAEDGTETAKRGAHITIDSDEEDFDLFTRQIRKMPWVIALVFLVVGSIFLTPVILLVGIIWYKLRKARLQNEAMLRLAEKGIVPAAQAADALSTGASPASVAPQVYQQAVALRKRIVWSDLRKGVILSMIGLAFLAYEGGSGGGPSWIGLVLLFVGVGYIVIWWLEGRHFNDGGPAHAGNAATGAGASREANGNLPGSSGT